MSLPYDILFVMRGIMESYLERYNPHWKNNFSYGYALKRNAFNNILKYITKKQIITISGLRRVGKTVLMKQIINHLIEQGINRTTIVYYSFDEEQPAISSVINEFEKLSANCKDKIYVFLDEIQKLANWQEQIKFYYDNRNIKFFVSGSASLFVREKAKESLAGRSFDFYLPPLSFKEYLHFRKKEELLKQSKLFQTETRDEFSRYISRQFIETVNEDKEYTSEYVKSILEKVVYIDLPKVFRIEYVDLLLRLLKIIASNPGMIIEYENLAKELGINRVTLSNYLFYLEESFLLKKIYNFSKNALTSEKKSKKFYLSSTSFFSYLNPQIDESKLVENIIITETSAKFFWRTPAKDEVDLILENFNYSKSSCLKVCPIEVKYKNYISDKDMRSILKFCVKYSANTGIIITKDSEDKKTFTRERKKIQIKLIPAWKFLLEL